jgi:hypothetical protein
MKKLQSYVYGLELRSLDNKKYRLERVMLTPEDVEKIERTHRFSGMMITDYKLLETITI